MLSLLLGIAAIKPVLTVSPTDSFESMIAGRSNVEIRFKPGEYFLKTPLKLGSGVTLKGEANVRLIGGSVVKRWRLAHDPRVHGAGAIYECDLGGIDPGELHRRGFGLPSVPAALELFEDGQPLRLASWPNQEDWIRTGAGSANTAVNLDDDRPSTWSKDDDVWTLGYWQFDWAESYEPVKSIEGRILNFAQKPGTYDLLPGRRFRFLNVLEELDQPGEYYVDRKLRKVFVWPTKPLDKSEVIDSEIQQPMIQIDGVKDVRIENLNLECGRDGAILATNSQNVVVDRCGVRNFGTFGVSLERCKDSDVKSCDLTGLGELGISLDGGDRKTLTPGHLLAENNHIWNYSRWCRTYKPAVLINGVGNRISHNWIHDAPHQAILLSGNDHVIEYNRIERVCTETGDAGAIYMGRNPTMRGTVIRYNTLHDLGPKIKTEGNYTGVMGVYLDDCWCGTAIFGNVFDMSGTGIMIGGGRDNTVENNVFLGCQPAIHLDARGIGWAKDFFKKGTEWGMFDRFNEVSADKPPYSVRYPQLATYLADRPEFPKGNRIVRNIAWGGQWMTLLDGLTENDFVSESNIFSNSPSNLAGALRPKPNWFKPIHAERAGLLKERPSRW